MAGEVKTATPPVVSFTCGGCGAPIIVRAKGFTVTAVCSACGSFSAEDNGEFKLILKAQEAMTVKPSIALGVRGLIAGVRYEVIGFMQRSEPEYPDAPWDEYLLYNPYQGYAWLSQYHGHWNLYKPIKGTPQEMGEKLVSYLGTYYDVYHRGEAEVQFVVGEFYWEVRIGDKVKTLDAVKPPHILSKEIDGKEVNWSDGFYIEPEVILSVFRPDPMPVREGVAPDQPGAGSQTKSMSGICFLLIFILLIVQILSGVFNPEKSIRGIAANVPSTGLTETEVAKFSIDRYVGSAIIHLWTNVSNSWLTANLRIVPLDPTNPDTHAFEKDISFYSGYDSDGSWAEGSRSEDFLINALPKGEYRVLLSSTPETGKEATINTAVTLNAAEWSNFWLAVFLLIIPPVFMLWRFRVFERARWSESEYSVYASKDDSDD
jgi:hypothetical protein